MQLLPLMHLTAIAPFCQPFPSQYRQLVWLNLLFIGLCGFAGETPPAEPDFMKAVVPSMVGPNSQLVVPVATCKYFFEPESCWSSCKHQSVSLTMSIFIINYMYESCIDNRVAEVCKLSANAKNAFNSFVGRVFANSRQKMSFFRVIPKSQQKW